MENVPVHVALLDREYLQNNYHDAGFSYLLPEILELFRGQATIHLEAIERYLRQPDLYKLAQEAHTLKGTAGSIGATAIAQAAHNLEHMGPDTTITEVALQVADLRKISQQTEAAITEELARLAAEADANLGLL